LNLEDENRFHIAHHRLTAKPSRDPQQILLSIDDCKGVRFEDKLSVITGIAGSQFQLDVFIRNEFEEDLTSQYPALQITQGESDVRGHDLEKEGRTIQFTIPQQVGSSIWTFSVKKQYSDKDFLLKRDIQIQSTIGLPKSLTPTRIFAIYDNNSEITPANNLYQLKCGESYKVEFDILDANSIKFSQTDWKEKHIAFDSFIAKPSITDMSSPQVNIEKHSSPTEFPPYCILTIIARVGEFRFYLEAHASISKDITNIINSQVITTNIIPGKAVAIEAQYPPTTMKTYDTLDVTAWLEDASGNRVEDENTPLFVQKPSWVDEQLIPLTYANGIYKCSTVIKRPDDAHRLIITAGTRSTALHRGTRRIGIKEFTAEFSAKQTKAIAYGIVVPDKCPTIVAGNSYVTNAYVISETKDQLRDIVIYKTITDENNAEISGEEKLTKAGQYCLQLEVDKEDALLKKPIIVQTRFEVIPDIPSDIITDPVVNQFGIIGAGKWLWDGILTVYIVDKFGNICTNIKPGGLMRVGVYSDGSSVSATFQKTFEIKKGTLNLAATTFQQIPLTSGEWMLRLSFSPSNDNPEVSKEFTFSTRQNANVMNLQIEHLKKKIEAQDKLVTQLRQRFHLKYGASKLTHRETRQAQLLKELNELDQRESEKRMFTEVLDQLQKLNAYKQFNDYFLGNISSLGYIENMDSHRWSSAMLEQFNEELTSWLGASTLRQVVFCCDSNPAIASRLIQSVKEEISHRRDIKHAELYQLLPIGNNYPNFDQNDQQHLSFPPISAPGFLGYAVNLIFLDTEQLKINLRARLWYRLLRKTLVFDNTEHLNMYCQQEGGDVYAFTLDGYHRRGPSISLVGVNYRKRTQGFMGAPSKERRKQIREEIDQIRQFKSGREMEEHKLKKEEKQLNNLRRTLENAGNPVVVQNAPTSVLGNRSLADSARVGHPAPKIRRTGS